MKPAIFQLPNNLTCIFTKTAFLVTVLLLFMTQFTLAQIVRTVDNRPQSGAQFTTVAAAITASSDGDIIYIHPSSTSYGSVTINKTLTLVGMGHNPANMEGLRATLSSISFSGVCLNSVIKGLNFTSISSTAATDGDGIQIINNRITSSITGDSTGGTTDGWLVEGNYFTTTYFQPSVDVNSGNAWNIRNNYISGILRDMNNTTVITNNLFVNLAPSGVAGIFLNVNSQFVANNIFVFPDVDVTGVGSNIVLNFNNCMTWSVLGTTLTTLTGTGNFDNEDPGFVMIPTSVTTFYNNDYNVTNANAVTGGTDGTDLGLFGNGFLFDTNGRPHSMPYPELMTILNTVVQPGQVLNVTFKASQKN